MVETMFVGGDCSAARMSEYRLAPKAKLPRPALRLRPPHRRLSRWTRPWTSRRQPPSTDELTAKGDAWRNQTGTVNDVVTPTQIRD